MKGLPILALVLSVAVVASSCKKDSLCFEDELTGAYVGPIVDGFNAAPSARVTVTKNGCTNLTIQVNTPFTKTYSANSIRVLSSNGSYIGNTTTGEEYVIFLEKRDGITTFKATVGNDFSFEGIKQ